MNFKLVFRTAAVAWLGCCPSALMEPAASAQEYVPKKQNWIGPQERQCLGR